MNPPGWLVDRLPEWARSIRFRYTLLYSAVLFGLAAVVVAAIYLVLMMSLRGEPVSPTYSKRVCSLDGRCATIDYFQAREFARLLNSVTLTKLRNYSFGALGVLFVASLGVGWVVAGRVLRPIGRITAVAGKAIKEPGDLSSAVLEHKPGEKVSLTVVRNGDQRTIEVQLGTRPDQLQQG